MSFTLICVMSRHLSVQSKLVDVFYLLVLSLLHSKNGHPCGNRRDSFAFLLGAIVRTKHPKRMQLWAERSLSFHNFEICSKPCLLGEI